MLISLRFWLSKAPSSVSSIGRGRRRRKKFNDFNVISVVNVVDPKGEGGALTTPPPLQGPWDRNARAADRMSGHEEKPAPALIAHETVP